MKIILTHEQADFDALASLLGAYLLEPDSFPVLPNRLNRNLRAYISLFKDELPFIERRDLPNEPVELVILVDTQSLVSIRGMSAETSVRIIDHHTPRHELPDRWTLHTEDTGANTTIFVEVLQERGTSFTPIHATLLLLGIYEDTGSLTYTRTTHRDLLAAAFLLEHGASLKTVADYLNHPLSLQQEQLFEQLRRDIVIHRIAGHNIMIAQGDARNMDEELSTIAHKLRNLLDPDALFLLIETTGGIQMIARSTSDQIDVSVIAAHFGGGGHARASASLIRKGLPQDVYTKLVELLPDYIKPAVTVADIMSHRPQLLDQNTPVEEALGRMQRYGYEGYPVVENGRIIGLLTRREVDRATQHKLHRTAKSLMHAGSYAVHPSDTMETLQNVMIESGWGQIPVIEPATKEIIGIVTRTDLLKTLFNHLAIPGRHNLSDRLESALPGLQLALLKCVAEEAHRLSSALYIVGGFVRDLLLDQPSSDFDLVVEGDAVALAKSLQKRFGGHLTTHQRFGTGKWHIAEIRSELQSALAAQSPQSGNPGIIPDYLDFITARTEFYSHPTALPSVERGSIKHDLHRRDFTINTLAMRLDGTHYGELMDFYGGMEDLKLRLVRVLHSLSFVDDPTRMLRAVRYEQRYSFTIESRTLQLLDEAAPLLGRVSGERIRHELDHILDEPLKANMFRRIQDLGLFVHIHPSLVWDSWIENRLELPEAVSAPPVWRAEKSLGNMPFRRALGYALWLIRLPAQRVSEVSERLYIPSRIADQIAAGSKLLVEIKTLQEKSPSEITAYLDQFSDFTIYMAFLATTETQASRVINTYVNHWRDFTPQINGETLQQHGLRPGPAYKRILTELRAAWLDGKIRRPEEETSLLELLIAEANES